MIELKLEGSFWPDAYSYRRGVPCPVIQGVLFNGAPCTLLDGFAQAEVFIAAQRHERLTIFVNELLVGEQFDNRKSVAFDALQLQLYPLNDWVTVPYEIDHDGEDLERTTLVFKPARLEVELEHNACKFDLSLFCARSLPSVPVKGEIKLDYTYHLTISPAEPLSLDWFLEVAILLRRCLMFATGEATFTLGLKGIKYHLEKDGQQLPRSLDLLLPVTVPMVVRVDRDAYHVRYPDIETELPALLKAWFCRHSELEVVINGYCELLTNDGAEEEMVFLRVCQVLEHFHGIIFTGSSKYLPAEDWKQLRAWLQENLPNPLPGIGPASGASGEQGGGVPDIRTILIQRMGSLNKLSFRSKLQELFGSIPSKQIFRIMDNPPSDCGAAVEEFLRRVETTRHYLTHFDPEQRARILRGDEVEVATSRLFAALTFWLAFTLGVGPELAGRLANHAKRAMFLVAPKTRL